MPEISFYLLPSQSEKERQYFACKLIEKVYRTNHIINVLTDQEIQSRQLDDLLWTFRAGSFIPHQIYSGTTPAAENQVVIRSLSASEKGPKTIVNLSSRCPENLDHADRVLEILDSNEDRIETGRNRYRYYQKLGLAIHTHKIQPEN